MTIIWYGQSCFRLEGKNVRVLIDPFSKEIGLRPPRLNDNIYLVTHDHYDHNNVKGVSDESFVIDGPGEYEKAGVQIVGALSYHDDSQGAERGLNSIYVITMEGIRFCHLGDLGQLKLSDEQVDIIGSIDVLFVPVGGTYTIDGKQAVGIVKQIEPKIIVPMHYKVPGLSEDLADVKIFLKEIGIEPEEVQNLKINQKSLPVDETKVITFSM